MPKHPAHIPRKMFWSAEARGTSRCPDCGSDLSSDRHTYLIVVRQRAETEMLIASNDYGYFCGSCPVVVLDTEGFEKSASLGVGVDGKMQIAVPGIVDLDVIPDDKKDVPIGEDDNPVPLVEFTNARSSQCSTERARRPVAKRKRLKVRRRTRR